MITIEMGNVVSKINNISSNIDNDLINKLSYEIGGFGIAKQIKYLYNPISHMTYTGLVPHIINTLNSQNLKYKLIDKRQKPEPNANFIIQKQYKARDYQSEIVNKASSREVIQAATGAGKTFIMASLIAKFNVKPVLVIAPKVSLAYQIKEEFEKFLGEPIGILGGGHKKIEDITISTPNSVDKEYIKSIKFILFDEVHFLPGKTLFDIACNAVNAYYRIGVSATPWRDNGDDILIEAALNIRKPHLSINASKLISKGKLTPCEINFISIDSKVGWLKNYSDTYNAAIVNNNLRNNKIVKLASDSVKTGKTPIILINKVSHGNKLLTMLKQALFYTEKTYTIDGKNYKIGTVEFISGIDDLSKRQAVFQSVKEGFTKILIGSTIADEGLDLPILNCLILAGSGKSSTRAFQRVGRVLRLYPNKEKAIIYDFMDSNETFLKHSLYREALYKTEPLWEIKYL